MINPQTEINGYQTQLNLAIEKLQRLQSALLLETDAARQFSYEQEIKKLEIKISTLQVQVSKLEGIKGNRDHIEENLFDKKKPYELHCYSCNRDDHYIEVIQFMEKYKLENTLHVFIPSEHHDAPESFVARIIHNVFVNNDFHSPGLRYNSGMGEHNSGLKIGETTLHYPSTAEREIEREIKSLLQAPCSENIALFYRVELKKWNPEKCHEFIKYIVGGNSPNIPGKKIRIFYWLDTTDCNNHGGILARIFRNKKNPIETLKTTCQSNEQICFLPHLPPIDPSHLNSWFSQFCFYSTGYQGHIADIFSNKTHLRMAEVEPHLLALSQKSNRYRQ
jgi:hypothetical protein